MYPRVAGLVWLPSISTTRPSLTVTERLHPSGQSSGHAVSTVMSVVGVRSRTGMGEVYTRCRGPSRYRTLRTRTLNPQSAIVNVYPPRRNNRRRLRRAVCRQGAPARAGARHAGGPPQSPRLPTAAVSGGHGRPVARRHRRADPLGVAPPRQRARAAGRGAGDRPGGQACRPRPRRLAVVRLPDRRRRRRQLLFRPRRLGAARAVAQDARRCVEGEGADAGGVRAGGADDRSGRAQAPAHLRARRRRRHRRGDGRRDRRDRAPDAVAGVSVHPDV